MRAVQVGVLPLLVCCGAVAAAAVHVPPPCADDFDCGFNGACESGTCRCDKPWTGPQCSTIALAPAIRGGGYNVPATTSWGGSVLRDDSDGTYWMWASDSVSMC